MSGFATVFAKCVACKTMIGFNPKRVPSIDGEPLCASCHAKWNEIHRVSKGLEPIPPHPDAYEPISAEEL